jgi:hypothetical protein
MSYIRVDVSKDIPARAEAIYAILCDYRVGHQAILPRPEFVSLDIEKGGGGAGTEYTLTMRLYGQTYTYQHRIEEPRPGFELVEIDRQTGERASWFTLEPQAGSTATRVTISSQLPVAAGFTGIIQRLMQPRIMRKLFERELDNLAAYVKRQEAQPSMA